MGAMNFPTSIKMNGVHLVPTITETATGIPAWTNLFIDWDWTGWVKKQVDYAVGNRIGCNCIGIIGCMDGVHSAAISQNTVNSRWTQLASYCAGLGVYIYPKLIGFNQMTGCTDNEMATYCNSIVSALSSYSNVIGFDLIPEADNWDDGSGVMAAANATRCNTLYTAVKGTTSMPCTFSDAHNWTDAATRTWMGRLSLDYLDFHPYAVNNYISPMPASDANYWFTTYNKDLFFGECGSPQSDSVDVENTFLRSVASVANLGDVRFRGWMHWAAQDQDTVSSNEWGLHDASWNQRQNKANVLRQFTGGSIVRANHQVLGS